MSTNETEQTTALEHPNAALLRSATKGFDYLFTNDIAGARKYFEPHEDPYHLLGLGVCTFLEAALGMEVGHVTEASRLLALSEAGTRRQMKIPKPVDINYHSRFHYGLEWEVLNADAVVLLGLTHALSESYMGYLQCMYSLNSAHSKFTKLFKTVFPNGLPTSLDAPSTSSLSPTSALSAHRLVHKTSVSSLASVNTVASTASAQTISTTTPTKAPPPATKGFFSRWVGTAATVSTPALPLAVAPDGPVEDFIMAGTAFGYGLFNLVFSLLPKKVQGLVGFFGFQSDRKLALQALAVAATKEDVHGVFAALTLMTYQGIVLLMSGYQADEKKLLGEYLALVNRVEPKYPSGALWILNRAKILRMGGDAEAAIKTLEDGLVPGRTSSFVQADMLLIFELAWTLLGQRRYAEAAERFLSITEMNSWSHGTYYFIAAGCYVALGDTEKAQTLLDAIPDLIDKKKMTGKDLPTEVFIKKKLAFYKEKQARWGGDEAKWVDVVKISPAEELCIFWNTHARISPSIAQLHIEELSKLTPPPTIHKIPLSSPTTPTSKAKLSFQSFKVPDPAKSPSTGAFPPTPTSATGTGFRPLASPSASSTPLSGVVVDEKKEKVDLDTPDELAIRALLLGIHNRTVGAYEEARGFFVEAHGHPVDVATWVGGLAMFELAVLDLKEAEATAGSSSEGVNEEVDEDVKAIREEFRRGVWGDALKSATEKLEVALSLAGSNVDLSSRLDSRIAMLKDEIEAKKIMLGIQVIV